MVIVWLIFTIEITLQENEEDASGVANPGRTAELIKVRPVSDSQPCCLYITCRNGTLASILHVFIR